MADHNRLHLVRYALELAFKGTAYCGWQSQSNAPSVQEKLEEVLTKVLREPIKVVGCGRTDTGVHARYFVVHFNTDTEPGEKFLFRMNQTLPQDIAIRSIQTVSEKFHARFSPVSRKYEYHIHQRKEPFLEETSYFRYGDFDREAVAEACEYLLTLEDFKTFSRTRTNVNTFRCRLDECRWEYLDAEQRMVFHVRADRFLRNMVRAMVGTFLAIGSGEMSLDQLKEAMASGDRGKAGRSVPAHGLYLTEVVYNWSEFVIDGAGE